MNMDDITIWSCPKAGCSGMLIKRKNRYGESFLGCTNYPRCTYTQPDETSEEDE